MPWLKLGDNAATHPLVMALATVPASQDTTINEVFGFVARLATQSAGHMTDYRVDLGTAQLIGGTRTDKLLRQAVAAGLLITHGKGRSRTWQIVEDDDLFHIRRRDEVEWDRQRKRDAANPDLTVPVRIRDGDACRYCGNVVYWSSRRGARGGTYDHREPGKPATVETYVVSCRGCNSSRKEDSTADDRMPLLPAPDPPIYTPQTVKWLAGHGIAVEPTDACPGDVQDTKRDPGRRAGTPRAARPGETSPDTAPPARPDTTSDTARPDRTVSGMPSRPGGHEPDNAPPTRGIAQPEPGAAKRDPTQRDTARPGASASRTSSRPGDPTPDNAPPTWGHNGHSPPDWAIPQPDLQIPADPSRKEGYGPGRVGSGRNGTGAARSAPLPSSDSSFSSGHRRRARRGR